MRSSVLERDPGAVPLNHGGEAQNDDQTKARLLAALRARFLLESPEIPVVDVIFDDLERILGEGAALTASEVASLTPRLHALYRRAVRASRHPNSGVRPATVAASHRLLFERFPPEFLPALAHLRRLALAVSDLLDELLEDMP
ncbi:DUF6415 family natural product biosynthesis protein [Streptomyces sp. MST-110588]|uniref:DUF6415 family natural product biosynthesis protein n=1 Tax=Streptomyces sp. MST-110588 TaxID=2833628 RepID=UPI001F5C474F|nr:DUF6415 family natural product biosynthesis protein [Streptomyces sp. MST-110588]UNO42150.1 hypothetical protein KGS77_24840 [Streptomyces sp. MST-110588]